MPDQPHRRYAMPILGIALALAGGVAGWGFERYRLGSNPAGMMTSGNRAATEQVVHDYLLAHPEVLPQAMDNLRHRESSEALDAVRDQVNAPYPGAVLGNPQGKLTIVEFTDYACTFCRRSMADVEALIAENPDLRVVVREFPILSPASAQAAKLALAAAQQGKYAAFHRAMFEVGHPDGASMNAAAQTAGVDLAKAQAAMADPAMEAEIARNIDFASRLAFRGTPSWVIGDTLLSGAVGKDKLAEAIAAARK